MSDNATRVDLARNEPLEFELPEFTMKQIIDSIPKHCFKSSALLSLSYVFRDLFIMVLLASAAWRIPDLLSHLQLPKGLETLAWLVSWNAYWFAAGTQGMGLWVLAHECGHGAFSSSKLLNDTTGLILDSLFLVPYHSWRLSHAQHHAGCGHLHRDEIFVPRTRSELGYPPRDGDGREDEKGIRVEESRQNELASAIGEAVGETPLAVFSHLLFYQVLGIPLYFLTNASGQLHYKGPTDHFRPSSPLFANKPNAYWQILLGDFGVFVTLAALCSWGVMRENGWWEVARMYVGVWAWVNQWLVVIPFLQHTDPLIPHYSSKAWTFSRGALTTVDRSILRWVGPFFQHGIAETHTVHHLASRIPHYHAAEATEAVRKLLGKSYSYSSENVFVSMWKTFNNCLFIEDEGDVRFYKDRRGVARAFVKDA